MMLRYFDKIDSNLCSNDETIPAEISDEFSYRVSLKNRTT